LGSDASDFSFDSASAYRLWQVNFHSPSEHSLNGKKMPLEMQLMHQRVVGGGPEIAVVVVFFADAANAYNDFLDVFVRNLPQEPWEGTTIQPAVVPFASNIGGSPYFHYDGSLTVPPCETNVKYYLRESPILAANAQLSKFAAVLSKTCRPKGNFRSIQPFHGRVVLLPSVDFVTGSAAKPKNKGVNDDVAVTAENVDNMIEDHKKVSRCREEEYDNMYNNIDRVAVGDPDYLVLAKNNFLRQQRNIQAAEGNYQSAKRAHDYQKSLYDNAPGLVEKIHVKWALDNAAVMKDHAKHTVDALKGSLAAPLEEVEAAFEQRCHDRHAAEVLANASKASVYSKPDAARASVSDKPYDYPEPRVSLPRGLAASPFTAASDAGSNAGASLAGVKIAPNLQQADVPPNAGSGQEAEPTQASARSLQLKTTKVLRITLPIDSHTLVDEGRFKKDMIDALAKTAHISPENLEVTGLKDATVAAVREGFPELWMSQHGTSSKRHFLRASST